MQAGSFLPGIFHSQKQGSKRPHGGEIAVRANCLTARHRINRGWSAPSQTFPVMQNSESPAAQPLRILLVDDFAEIRALIATMLARLGYEVDVAGDGAAGWEAFRSKRYDLLITDNDMPVLTGLEFVRRVRAVPDMLPVIVISGFSPWDDADVNSLLKPGAFISKPFTFPLLRATIVELTDGKRAGSDSDSLADSR